MSCKNVCRLCDKIRITTAVNIADGTVVYNLPAGSYNADGIYCIVLAQNVPSTAEIGANVVFSIGGTAVQYPFLSCDCKPLTSCAVRGRTRYKVRVETTPTGGVFKLIGRAWPCPTNNLTAIDGTAPTAPATPANDPVARTASVAEVNSGKANK